ncbi:MAG: hypothetical protein KDD61_12710 [Bdellovibrionales bacterium]|nr:hypothetical protein [Bdellovibrionales bacterium]
MLKISFIVTSIAAFVTLGSQATESSEMPKSKLEITKALITLTRAGLLTENKQSGTLSISPEGLNDEGFEFINLDELELLSVNDTTDTWIC